MYTIPSLRAVTLQLRQLNNQLRLDAAFVEGDVDVRLQITESKDPGTPVFQLHSGDASYDTDHTGIWGATGISANESEFDAETVARVLLEEATEAATFASEEPLCLCRYMCRDLCHYHAFVDGQS